MTNDLQLSLGSEYWAAAESEKMPDLLQEKAARYYDHISQTGRLELWRRSNQLYYGLDGDDGYTKSSHVTYGGRQGEIVQLRINEYRSLLEHMYVLVTGTRPTLTGRPVNADAKSLNQAKLATSVFEFYLDEKQIEQVIRQVTKLGIRLGEGWHYLAWDPMAGEVYDADIELGEDGEPVGATELRQGDLVSRAVHPVDVIRDPAHDLTHGEHRWLIMQSPANRWDLIAEHPEHEEEIRQAQRVTSTRHDVWTRAQQEDLDRVTVWELFHGRCPAMPEGRYVKVVAGTKAVLADGVLPYERIPLIPMRPDIEIRTGHGYSTAWDLMGPQSALDSTVSTMLTNHDAFGVQNIWTEKGSDLSVADLAGGLKHLESNTKPEVLQLTQTSEHSYKLWELILQGMERTSGINSTARGNPDANVKSGAMAALVHAMAVQYNSGLLAAHADLYERTGTHFLDVARRYMTVPRLVAIGGERAAAQAMDFVGGQVDQVRRIAVDIGNALTRTTAGRQDAADKLLERQMIQRPEQYLQMISTGRLEPLTDRPETKWRGIASENDKLVQGMPVKGLVTDHHADHIDAHLALLDEPNLREDDQLVGLITAHIQWHIDTLMQMSATNPMLLQATGQTPVPMAPPMGPSGPPAPNPGGETQGVTEAPPPAMGDVSAAQMPGLPNNPQDGEQYDPMQGGVQ
jgi:hypothetical protein